MTTTTRPQRPPPATAASFATSYDSDSSSDDEHALLIRVSSPNSSVHGDDDKVIPSLPPSPSLLAIGDVGDVDELEDAVASSRKHQEAQATTTSTTTPSTKFTKKKKKEKTSPFPSPIKILSGLIVALFLATAAAYSTSRAFRRSVTFWRSALPLAIEYRYLVYLHDNSLLPPEAYRTRLASFRRRSAPQIVSLIMDMGGIYVKIGQVWSTVGRGIMPEEYVTALRPLQDGVPARPYGEVARIIEASTGRRMEDIFDKFEEEPIGAASIAQAHRATLKKGSRGGGNGSADGKGDEVVVKVQYPEVSELFELDLTNLHYVTLLFAPENIERVKAMRERHRAEMDFTDEARNLREVGANMVRHGVAPGLVTVPSVRNETGLCGRNVLVMDYLEGTALSDVVEDEQDRMARAWGKRDAEELRADLAEQVRRHFRKGGGERDGAAAAAASGEVGEKEDSGSQEDGDGGSGLGGALDILNSGGRGAGGALGRIVGPMAAARLFRTYVGARERVLRTVHGARNVFANVVRVLTLGAVRPKIKKRERIASGPPPVDLAHVIKVLIHVHGIQMIRDGVYNADPHPGNVLVLPDGRLGLLDYGMVGRLSSDDRLSIAKTIVALSRKEKAAAAAQYVESGFRATHRDEVITDSHVLHRFASFHLDKIDLSPIVLEDGRRLDTLRYMRDVRERAVPKWVGSARRLGGLLQGVAVQAARPVSLAKEWEPIARRVVVSSS